MSVIYKRICIGKSHWELDFCLLSGNEKCPLLGGCVSTTIMLNLIRNMTLVHCREVVLFSEGPLSEARLYMQPSLCLYVVQIPT